MLLALKEPHTTSNHNCCGGAQAFPHPVKELSVPSELHVNGYSSLGLCR